MLTLHAADALLTGAHAEPLPAGAVAVDGGLVAAVGPYAELAEAYPGARTRRWPGLLTPGLVHAGAAALLEEAYHPDPREADRLGTEPLTGVALAALELDDTRWGASARRGLQRLLRYGVTAVAGPFRRAPVRTAVSRAGVVVVDRAVVDRTGGPATDGPVLDPLTLLRPQDAFAGTLAPGARADLAVFDVSPAAPGALGEPGAGTDRCVATVLAGRLVHRRR